MNVSCPDCGSDAFKRNGYTRHGKQNHRCLDCGRQFSMEIQELIQNDNMNNFRLDTIEIAGVEEFFH